MPLRKQLWSCLKDRHDPCQPSLVLSAAQMTAMAYGDRYHSGAERPSCNFVLFITTSNPSGSAVSGHGHTRCLTVRDSKGPRTDQSIYRPLKV